MRIIRAVLILSFVLLIPTVVFSEGFIVETTGLGDIVNGKIETARDKGIENALRLAVEEAVGTLISQESRVRNGELIEDSIFKKSQGFIRNYSIIDERIDEAYEVVWVTVRAEVMTAEIQQSLRDIIEAIGTLTTFIHIEGNRTFTLMLINILTENGIEVIDSEQLQEVNDRQKAAMLQDESEGLDDLSLWFGTKYVLKGTAEEWVESYTSFGNQVEDLYFQYDIELLDSVTAQRLGSFSNLRRSQSNTGKEMVRQLVTESAEDLRDDLPRLFLTSALDKETIEFIVIGVNDFEQRLQDISNITSLDNVEAYGERLKYKLRYNGNLNTLFKRLGELGLTVERYQNSYIIRKLSTEIQIEISNASFSDLKKIRGAFEALIGLSYSNKIVTFSIENDVYSTAEKLDSLGYSIIEMNDKSITAQKGE